LCLQEKEQLTDGEKIFRFTRCLSNSVTRSHRSNRASRHGTVSRRTSKEPSGLVGTWKPQSLRNTSPAQVKYELSGKRALRVSNDLGITYTIALDGEPVLVSGPAVIPTMIVAREVDDHTIETIHSREGTVTGKKIMKISPDGKTLTLSTSVGPNNGGTFVRVFEKL
jgi:hypothetical protein